MKRLLIALLLLGLIPSAKAANNCNFVSEYFPDVTIEINKGEFNSVGRGKIIYKDKPFLNFETGISNGYGGQYYVIRKLKEDPKKERETIAFGPVVIIIDNQLSRGTPKNIRKRIKIKKLCSQDLDWVTITLLQKIIRKTNKVDLIFLPR